MKASQSTYTSNRLAKSPRSDFRLPKFNTNLGIQPFGKSTYHQRMQTFAPSTMPEVLPYQPLRHLEFDTHAEPGTFGTPMKVDNI